MQAEKLGFSACGISKVEFLKDEESHLRAWLSKKYNAEMQYMENHFEKRLSPAMLVENSKSVISVLLNYLPAKKQTENSDYNISKYAYGKDYHLVVKEKLYQLIEFINSQIAKIEGRVFVDSAPVMERVWAKKSGLGWIGKNSLLLTKKGSYFFIGEIICDLELAYDTPINEYCGTCSKCIDACPTNAITEPYVINSNKCLSYLTIEKRGDFSSEINLNNQIFGCDICQDVCPWNSKSQPTNISEFSANSKLLTNTNNDWDNLTKEEFNEIFRKSAVKRTKFEGLKRNIVQAKNTFIK